MPPIRDEPLYTRILVALSYLALAAAVARLAAPFVVR